MVYCIVEGHSDYLILDSLFRCVGISDIKIILSHGFPSMPAVARTIMSFMDRKDKVMIVCDQDNFQIGGNGRDMFGFLLRGAMNNPSFQLFTFEPNIDHLVIKEGENKRWKNNSDYIIKTVNEHINDILKEETVIKIIEFASK